MASIAIAHPDKALFTELFRTAFTIAEDEHEGALVADLTAGLVPLVDQDRVWCFGHYHDDALVGAIFFSRLEYPSLAGVYLLAPVAVRTDFQRQGVGQTLIRYGLTVLAEQGAQVALTYGDPAYYGRFGFQPLSETLLQAPLTLSMPFGWQGQSLQGGTIPQCTERPQCVEPFANPALW
ncbi:GNAT family N-acetyltransferase [Reinekea blandensis]|uniref:Predicted acetyltransferase n=1 Tax=Reinekea blandensis MED297 TaxID=314283 RepID=A4BB12_9GAMM|nr:N-acetyltransferase [Reinekea blandensis]EAR10625.1 predicted acetyltransferase [Reinekea sp. MED297] [Reinekea blandensis MED297]